MFLGYDEFVKLKAALPAPLPAEERFLAIQSQKPVICHRQRTGLLTLTLSTKPSPNILAVTRVT